MSKRNQGRRLSPHELAERISWATVVPESDKPLVRQDPNGLFIPNDANLSEIISELQAIDSDRRSGDEKIQIEAGLLVPPWEGARALAVAIMRTFGILRQLPDQYGRREQLHVEIGSGKTEQIPWGLFDLPGLSGYVAMKTRERGGQVIFHSTFHVPRKYQDHVDRLVDRMAEVASNQCLHRGQAFAINFRDAEGKMLSMPMPASFPLSGEEPVFTQEISASIERNILVPIRYADELIKKGVSLKRGALFEGTYGVGKTLLASYIAKMATSSGWTFIYVKNSSELPDALRFAQRYQPVVIFGEDIDRVAGIDRTDKVNELLNQLDGIDGKTVRMLTILTTNHFDRINPAMLRPGRIDLVLHVLPPDAETVELMLRKFGADSLAEGIDLTEPSLLLAGQSPARIREMLQRSTLEVLRRTGDIKAKITSQDLVAMAHEVRLDTSAPALAQPPLLNGSGAHAEA